MRLDALFNSVEIAATAAPKLQRLMRATKDVEAIFLQDLLRIMRRSVPKSSLGDSIGKGVYEDLFDQALAQGASQSGSFGIGKLLYERLEPLVLRQEMARLVREGSGVSDRKSVV